MKQTVSGERNDIIFLDTETCGLHGPLVIIQYARNYDPPIIHDAWHVPVEETLRLIEEICDNTVICFNTAFDWFHLCQIYNIFRLLPLKEPPKIEEAYSVQDRALLGPCLKPRDTLDLMIYLKKDMYQATMDRKPIKIRRIPVAIAEALQKELEKRIKFRGIFFARRKKQGPIWRISETKNPDFVDLVLEFKASGKLKHIIEDLFPGDVIKYEEVEINKKLVPSRKKGAKFKEWGFAPTKGNWNDCIQFHINHWTHHMRAREYACNDVLYLQKLYSYLGEPLPGDDDSVLAAMVGTVRWKGYDLDLDKIKILRNKTVPAVPTSSRGALKYIHQVMDDIEKMGFDSTKKERLKDLINSDFNLEAAKRAKEVFDARSRIKERELYDKLLLAGRFHASLKVLGTLSSRMAGGDDLNAQAIKRTTEVRECFLFGKPLSGGDFKSFEVCIAEAVYSDEKLREFLLSGKSLHAFFGTLLYPGMSYDDINATKGKEAGQYDISKNCVFSLIYGAEWFTLANKYNIPEDIAEKAYYTFLNTFPGVKKARDKIKYGFEAMSQPGGIGTGISWRDPQIKIASLFGFERNFELETQVMKELFNMASRPPEALKNCKIKVNRRDRIQTASGAVQSALYGCAFSIQSSNQRAAINHVVQSTGATITKKVQRAIWDLQPHGIGEWLVQPVNIHDEILCPTSIPDQVEKTVQDKVKELTAIVPLLAIGWKKEMQSWAEK